MQLRHPYKVPTRKDKKNNPSVIVTMPRDTAANLIEKTNITSVEWNRCRIEPKIKLNRCFRSQGYGHQRNVRTKRVSGVVVV